MNKYDLEHVCTSNTDMTKEQWEGSTARPGSATTPTSMSRRSCAAARAAGINLSKIVNAAIVFSGATRIEGVHPLQFGVVRRKSRTQRRHGMPIESPFIYYPRRAAEFVGNVYTGLHVRRYLAIKKRVKADRRRSTTPTKR